MKIKGYTKKYDDSVLFDNFDMDIEENKITVILGNSGLGKTTLLNALSGLDNSYQGTIESRPSAYIFQEPRLLNGATVYKNIDLVCKNKALTESLLNAVELYDSKDKYPSELSGGMARRVSMARAFASERDVLLMDEPFVSLDVGLKYRLIEVFKKLWSEKEPTTIMVTHDPDEAVEIADRIVIFDGSPIKIVFDMDLSGSDRTHQTKEIIKNFLIN